MIEKNSASSVSSCEVLLPQVAWDILWPVYVHPNIVDMFPHVELQRITFCNQPSRAKVFAVADPVLVDAETKFLAGVIGASLVSIDFLRSDGKNGICVAWKRAMSIKRQVHITAAFMRDHTQLCRCLADALKLVECKWKLVTADAFQDNVVRCACSRPLPIDNLKSCWPARTRASRTRKRASS